jgi:saccharopine dehydrogenase (NADP+, L-glutamate forming)
MKVILIIGAGRSSSSLIAYLLAEAVTHSWNIIVGDVSLALAQERVGNSAVGEAILFDIHNEANSRLLLAKADVVISLMPAFLHPVVARYCLALKKHLLTASYVSDEMRSLHEVAQANDLLFLNESGLDPGIDHMSAMHVIDKIKHNGGKLLSFESFTGGLITPETDAENPWRYKFTWNPRNVVMAGQAPAKFLQQQDYKYIPYQQLFKRTTPIYVPGYGDYEGYANRDSLTYIDTYGLQGINTMLRGTLRNKGFCDAWNVFVQLGCCDDTYRMENVAAMTHRDFINSFLPYDVTLSVEDKLMHQLKLDAKGGEMVRLRWSGLFDTTLVGLDAGTPAQILEHILNKRWKLNPHDIDLIVMWHRFVYTKNGEQREVQAWLTAKGNDNIYTAMAKTVGLPLGIATKLLLQGKIKQRGVVVPIQAELYEPILAELKLLGIALEEKDRLI